MVLLVYSVALLPRSASAAKGRQWARRRRVTAGVGYWCAKAWSKGLRHLATGQPRLRTLIYI